MTLTNNPPADIVHKFLVDQGLFTNPSDDTTWPAYYDALPDQDGGSTRSVEDNAAGIFDVEGLRDGRYMSDGTTVVHPGLTILVRSLTYATGWAKAKAVAAALNAAKNTEVLVTVDDDTQRRYRIRCASQQTNIFSLRPRKNTDRRKLFSLNYLATLEETTVILTASTLTTLAHTTDATLTAEQMEGWLHTNEGAGASEVDLTLPSAADGLHAGFAQVDAGDFLIRPAAGETILWSGGTLSAGEALKLGNVCSTIYLVSDGNSRWICMNENGDVREETP